MSRSTTGTGSTTTASTTSGAHYGLRTNRWKLIRYYADGLGLPRTSQRTMRPEWKLFDLQADPHELRSLHNDPAYATVFARLRTEL